MMNEEEFLKLPVITLRGLEGKPETTYSELQKLTLPYLDQMMLFWWLCFWGLLAFLVARFIVLPLLRGERQGGAIHPGPAKTLCERYCRIFFLHEVSEDVALRLFGGAILLGYLVTFGRWQMNPATSVDGIALNAVTCWPFFQGCRDWLWMRGPETGYSQQVMFMIMFGFMVLAAHSLFLKRVALAHLCILILFAFKAYLTSVSMSYHANYDLYHNFFNIIFLFLPHKRFFGSLTLVWFYFLSTAAKNHPTWVWGGYFTPLNIGLAFVPRGWEMLATNLIIFMEMIMAWFLLSHRKWIQRSVFGFFCFFHLYSGTIVDFHYPTIVMPSLLIFYGTLFRPFDAIPLNRASVGGWTLMLLLLIGQMMVFTTGKDSKLTMEHINYGLYMFDANHQCRVTVSDSNGIEITRYDSIRASLRCNSWYLLSKYQSMFCRQTSTTPYRFRIIHSINGGPFYEIVNEPDLCSVHYNATGTNDWIKDDKTAPAVGRPRQNVF